MDPVQMTRMLSFMLMNYLYKPQHYTIHMPNKTQLSIKTCLLLTPPNYTKSHPIHLVQAILESSD